MLGAGHGTFSFRVANPAPPLPFRKHPHHVAALQSRSLPIEPAVRFSSQLTQFDVIMRCRFQLPVFPPRNCHRRAIQ